MPGPYQAGVNSSGKPGSPSASSSGGGGGGGGGKSTGSGGGPAGPGASIAAAKANAKPALSANPNNAQTQNAMRAFGGYTGPGATPYIGAPSLGQILGSIMSIAPIAGTLNNVGGIAKNALSYGGLGFDKPYDGGLVGSALDAARGVSPGAVTGASNPDVNQGFRASRNDSTPAPGTPNASGLAASILPQPLTAGQAPGAPAAAPQPGGFDLQAWIKKFMGPPMPQQPDFGSMVAGV